MSRPRFATRLLPDDVISKRFGNRSPILIEDREIHIVSELINNEPIIQKIKYRGFHHKGFCLPLRKHFERKAFQEYRCFFTNSNIYLAKGYMFEGEFQKYIHWAATSEHMVARYIMMNRYNQFVQTIGNLVVAGRSVNRLMSHLPLAMKLFERDHLFTFDFDREAMTTEAFEIIKKEVIRFETPYWFVDNYPWFSHAIKDERAKVAATEFNEELMKCDDLFMKMNFHEQRTYLNNPCEIDIPHLAKKILGLSITR